MNGDQRPSRLKIDEDHLHHRHRHDLEKKLDDKSLFGIGPLKLETTEKFDVEDVTFTLGTSGSCRLQVFNSMDDRDDEGILGTPRSEKTADQTVDSGLEALDFEPFICFDRDNAWIKYSLDGKARASAKTGVLTDITNFQLKAGHALSFDWYRKHNPSEQLGHAIRDDAGRFKFIVNQDDIEHLDENEALTMTVSGELKGVLDAQLSGILPSFFGKLSKLELFPGKLPIKIDTKLPVAAFSWSLKDDFVIVISKAGPNKYRLGLKKSRSHQKSGDLFLGFQVKTAPSGALTHLLKKMEKAFFGAPQEELQTIIKKCPPEKTIAQAATSCDESERHVLSMTADRLDLDENTNTLADIADWLKKNGHKIKPTVEHLLNHTVKFGLDYGYNRTETNTLFFETEVDDTVLNRTIRS